MLKRVLITLAYILGAAFLVGATIVLVAVGKGYSYDFREQRLIKNGLIIINTVPKDASIYIDGKDIHRRSPFRSTLEAGEYDLAIKKDGHKSWAKRVLIRASEVTYVIYAFLFPEKIEPKAVATHTDMFALSASRNGRFLAYGAGGSDSGVWVFDSSNRKTTKIYASRPASDPTPAEQIIKVTWSDDNEHLLVRTTLGEVSNYLVLDLNLATAAVNLTDSFKYDFATARFSLTDWRQLYWISPEGLRRVDINSQSTSAVLVDKVKAFALGGDRVYYIQETALGNSLNALEKNGTKHEIVQSLAQSNEYQIIHSHFKDRDYLAVLPTSARTLTLYSEIFSKNPVAKVLAKDTGQILFNLDGRYLGFSGTSHAGSYDLEKQLLAQFSVPAVKDLNWFDEYHMIFNQNGQLTVVEFDGANMTSLMKTDPNSAVYAVAGTRSVAGILKTENGASLMLADIIR